MMLSYSIRNENKKNPPRCDQMLTVSLLQMNMLKIDNTIEPCREKNCLRSIQPQKMIRCLKFRI